MNSRQAIWTFPTLVFTASASGSFCRFPAYSAAHGMTEKKTKFSLKKSNTYSMQHVTFQWKYKLFIKCQYSTNEH